MSVRGFRGWVVKDWSLISTSRLPKITFSEPDHRRSSTCSNMYYLDGCFGRDGSTLSSQISCQNGYMLFGQKYRHELYRAWQTTLSRTMQGLFISFISPVCSLMSLVTFLSTLYVLSQYGTNSASQYIPLFFPSAPTVLRISPCDFTRTNSPG